MNLDSAFVAALAFALTGCGTSASFTRGMEEPIKAIEHASALADAAEKNVLAAVAVGLSSELPELKELICKPVAGGPSDARSHLQAFSDALDTVRKVGEKPDDTSYAGYIRKLRESAAAGQAPADARDEQSGARTREQMRIERCKRLFAADTDTGTRLILSKGEEAPPIFFTRLLGYDQLVKAFLVQAETLSREAAVKRTIEALLPDLKTSAKQLKAEPSPVFGPSVNYSDGAIHEAANMNKTVLGATVNARRWYVAKQVKAQWVYLSRCREARGTTCFGDPAVQMAVNSFVTSVYTYRSLASVDPVKIQANVDAAVLATENSLKANGVADWIDGLIGIADALSALDDAYANFDKSKD